jgi:hypothetical protein
MSTEPRVSVILPVQFLGTTENGRAPWVTSKLARLTREPGRA